MEKIDKILNHFGDALCKKHLIFITLGVQLNNRVHRLGSGSINMNAILRCIGELDPLVDNKTLQKAYVLNTY